jgi:hypothetical protein
MLSMHSMACAASGSAALIGRGIGVGMAAILSRQLVGSQGRPGGTSGTASSVSDQIWLESVPQPSDNTPTQARSPATDSRLLLAWECMPLPPRE